MDLNALRSRPWLAYTVAVVLSLAALLVRFALGSLLVGYPFLTFFPAVVLAAFLGGYRAGISAAVLGGLFADYFLIEPIYSLTPGSRSDAIGLAFYAFSSAVVVGLTHVMVRALERQKAADEALRQLNADLEAQVVKRTREALASEARLRTILETSYQFQGLLDLEGKLLDANSISLQSIHAALEDVIGKPFWETPWFTGTPGMPELVRAAIPAVAQGESLRQEILVNLPTGQRSFDFSMRPIRDENGQVTAIVPEAVELTERRKAEEALRQSQKMEAIGQLTGGIAHDFNNMLAIVIGSLDMACRRLSGEEHPQVAKCISNATEGAHRAASLTSRLLAFSRQQPLDPQPLDANKLVGSMSELLRRTLGETIRVETVLAGGLWRTFTDPSQLENSILNLAVNARDAMLSGGKLTIETANTDLDERYARAHSDVVAGQYVMVSVSDTGTGMPPEIIERAFDPFYTTKGVGKGTGLGLSQVFGFVKQSGGHVKIYSEIGRGSTVKLYLPRSFAAESVSSVVLPGAETLPPRGEAETIILVVEDEEQVRHMTVDALRELGYTVVQAGDGGQALEQLQVQPRIDLLLTDIVMPDMTGRQLADKARLARSDLKVLYTTGYTRNAVVHNGILDRGVAFLPKPFTLAQLALKVKEVLSN
jgi:PAS domain S-box-containing protein